KKIDPIIIPRQFPKSYQHIEGSSNQNQEEWKDNNEKNRYKISFACFYLTFFNINMLGNNNMDFFADVFTKHRPCYNCSRQTRNNPKENHPAQWGIQNFCNRYRTRSWRNKRVRYRHTRQEGNCKMQKRESR